MDIPTAKETYVRMTRGKQEVEREEKERIAEAGEEILKDIARIADVGGDATIYLNDYEDRRKYQWISNNKWKLEAMGYTVILEEPKSMSYSAYSAATIKWSNPKEIN